MTGAAAAFVSGTTGGSSPVLTAVAAPGTVSGSAATSTVTSGTATCTPAGGSGLYTYLWEAAAYNTDAVSITTPTAASTSFRRTGCISGDTYLGDFKCRVTDTTTSAQALSNVVSATITRT